MMQKQTSYELEEDNKDVEHLDGLGDTQEGPSEEIRTNFELISVFLKALFRIAVLVRKENPDTRFERAIRSSKCTFPPTFDIDHVREKYPKLKAKEQSWLAERLGKAIARRRQFIKYCRDHRDRLALDDENIEAERATTVMQSSKATTLDPEKIHVATNFAVDDYEDELVSNLSISTSTTTDVLSTLTLPRLADLSKDGEAFECPICFTLRYIKGERSWRLHAFHDLRPYSCTVGGAKCDSLAFQDRNSWFQHELDCHRSHYECSLCDCGLFSERAGLKSHILGSHGQFSEHQLRVMEDAGRRAPEEPQKPREESIEERLTDDEDFPSTDEEQHIDSSLFRQHTENTDYPKSVQTRIYMPEAFSNDHFERPPPTEALDQAIIPPILKEPTPPPLSDLEKDLNKFWANGEISLVSERLKDEISNALKAEKDRKRQYAEIMARSGETVGPGFQVAEELKRIENEEHILHLKRYAPHTARVKMICEKLETTTRERNERESRNQGN
ncbi:hypothetical protein H0G86_009582 [Trichoderma simmonsii]|uniref:Oxidoreductase acuF-like C2H2 type zinc-finger domain-containing protein n=1 Tax=Trichoderma simmonsii TaxID=1491479 RepID=A0A8G0PJ82_9HYPO|nr:hypothetical protein H0G86_009582 [Trichoderma simmonsii]